jgi:hypothetical protein
VATAQPVRLDLVALARDPDLGVPDLPPHDQKLPAAALGRPRLRPSRRPPKRGYHRHGAQDMAEREVADKGRQTGGPSAAAGPQDYTAGHPTHRQRRKVSRQRARPWEVHKHGDIHQIRSRAREIRPWRAHIRPNDAPDRWSW